MICALQSIFDTYVLLLQIDVGLLFTNLFGSSVLQARFMLKLHIKEHRFTEQGPVAAGSECHDCTASFFRWNRKWSSETSSVRITSPDVSAVV